MKVAFQGETGAFSEEAVGLLFPGAAPVPMISFENVFESVASGAVDRGVIPIENSLFGSVHANYDLLQTHDLWITNEVNLRVRHHLMAFPGSKIQDLRQVYSHPQALGQCQSFLRTHLAHVEPVPAYDTAGAAKMVANRRDPELAAIASAKAAEEYGLDILAESIESNHQNYTRFLALSVGPDLMPADAPSAVRIKTSIVYSMRENVPGALFKSLAVFALRDLDLFKIESRPLIGSPGNYLFYLDLEGSFSTKTVQRALDHLREIAGFVKVLGSYPQGRTVG